MDLRPSIRCGLCLLALSLPPGAGAYELLPAVADPGVASQIDLVGSDGWRQCKYSVAGDTCPSIPTPLPEIIERYHVTQLAFSSQPLSRSESFDPDTGGSSEPVQLDATASAETSFGVNRASAGALGQYDFFESSLTHLGSCNCDVTTQDRYAGYAMARAVSVWQDSWTFTAPPDFGGHVTVVIRLDGTTTDLGSPDLGYIFDAYYEGGTPGRRHQIQTAGLLITGGHWFAPRYALLPEDYYFAYRFSNAYVSPDPTTFAGPTFSERFEVDVYVVPGIPIRVGSLLLVRSGGGVGADGMLDVSHSATVEQIRAPAGVTLVAASGDASVYPVPEPDPSGLGAASVGVLLALRRAPRPTPHRQAGRH